MSGRIARSARIAAAAGGVVLLLLALALWGLAHSGAVDAWLTTHIAARVAPWLRFSGARVIWWPLPAVVLGDVEATHPAGAAALGAATAAAVTCRVRLASLLEGRTEIDSVRIEGLRITIARGPDG